jgi:uncharacterized protein (TIGR02118 family)
MDYYRDKHFPLVKELLGDAIKQIEIENGLAGGAPGAPPIYVGMGHMFFDSVEAFQNSFGPHMGRIMADLPNYTNIEPQVQISEVIL